MFGVLAIMGDLGCSLGPWIAGAVSDAAQASSRLVQLGITQGLNPEQIGLKSGIFAAVIFPLIMLTGVGLFKNQANETVPAPMEILDASHGETDIQRTSTIC